MVARWGRWPRGSDGLIRRCGRGPPKSRQPEIGLIFTAARLACGQTSGYVGSRAVATFHKALGQQVLVREQDNRSRDPELLSQMPRRSQLLTCAERAAEYAFPHPTS